MNTYLPSQPQLSQLLLYFSQYLEQVTRAISQVKSYAYSLLQVAAPISHRPAHIMPESAAIMAACKRSLDDIKRIQSVLKGHSRMKDVTPVEEGSSNRLVPRLNFKHNQPAQIKAVQTTQTEEVGFGDATDSRHSRSSEPMQDWLTGRERQKELTTRMESLKQSRQLKWLEMATEQQECIELVKAIKQRLMLRKRHKRRY